MRIVHAAVGGLLALVTGPSVATYTTVRATAGVAVRAVRDSPRTTGALATESAGARATSDAGATGDARASWDAGTPATRGAGARATRDAMAARSTGRLRGVLG
ncbi:hypothetical protein, partial [Microbispora triticiradicis]|uniref:hypothetical protein n=1 Tax=Microbispora triticiradicis TaxID=2200763 RepID=UPI001AD7B1A9